MCEAVIQHVDGEYLLLQRLFDKDIYPGMWEIGACGSALKGENKIEAVLREINEETGIDSGKLKEIYHIFHESHQSIYVGYLLITSVNKNCIQLQEKETIDYKWISKEDLIELYDGNQFSSTSTERLKDYVNTIR